ncbi:hypothetical protein ACTXM3_11860 [Glutamicibacter arilaitensis]|uniref:hypothetical protein n=1 Tax=Glutamicibacter arilaitensis TaxID=256701 RepID=UPI003FD27154
MSDYTPSTKTVRRAYAQAGNSLIHEEARADTFDRWLAKVRAEAKAEALEEAAADMQKRSQAGNMIIRDAGIMQNEASTLRIDAQRIRRAR